MDDNFNRRAIEKFGKDNRGMPLESPSKYFEQREGELATYIDMQIVIKWVLPYLYAKHAQKPSFLDVGAGKGRMTRYFAGFAERCVALEPFVEFYRDLQTTCTPYKNVQTYDLTLSEFVARYRMKFDFIYASGVTPYIDDEGLRVFFRDCLRCMEPSALMCVREWGSPSSTDYLPGVITRTREHLVGAALEAGLVCDR